MTVYVFPGQGSQIKGMGAELFEHFPTLLAQADMILGYSVQDLCLEDSNNQLNQTQYTQPLLYIINAFSYFKRIREGAKRPDYVAGHSLGEYNALLAADVFDFATGLRLVQKRGELMSKAQGGGMAAIIGLEAEAVLKVLQDHAVTDVVIANYNSHTQVVISGSQASVQAAQVGLEQAGAMVIPLKVSGAFHSPLMQQAKEVFAEFLSHFQFSPAQMPVIANLSAKPYEAMDIKTTLAAQITGSVRWCDTIEYLLSQGEENFEEVGPGQVLTGLIKRIRQAQPSPG
jgi:malonyl CoA-acyl carrier protein transacylase